MENIGRYQIVSELGRGAMGVVYRAVDPNIGRTVALKTMRLDAAGMEHDEMLRRFHNEARAAGLMNHPNIVITYDADQCDGLFYIAMEYLEGETLQSLISAKKILPAEEIVRIGKQVAAGLDYAHAMKVVHRDIKPANIMITLQNVVKIMDFGISKSADTMTRTGQAFGTPFYMSPEQVMGLGVDGRSDLFSLGAMLYEMATGERPFAGEGLMEIIYKIVNEIPIPPCELQKAVHPGMSAVISRCLAKKPDERYQTGAQLAEDLESFHQLKPADKQSMTVLPMETHANPAAATQRMVRLPTPALNQPMGAAEANRVKRPGAKARKITWTAAAVLVTSLTIVVTYLVQNRGKPSQPTTAELDRTASAKSIAAQQKTPAPNGASLESMQNSFPNVPEKGQASLRPGKVRIQFTSNPEGALVRFDGESSRSWLTPVTMADVIPGRHEVVFTKDGYSMETRLVEIGPNRSSSAYHVDLKPEMTALSVSSDPPGAKIEIDGTDTGKIAPAQIPVTEGQHTVVLRLPGYQPAQAQAQVARGQIYDFPERLAPIVAGDSGNPNANGASAVPNGKGLVDFVTVPPGASIFIEGRRANVATPAHNLFPPGDYSIQLRREGYKPVQRVVHVEAGQVAKVEAVLTPQ